MSTMRQKAMFYLCREIKNAKLALHRAEDKQGAEDETRNLRNKITTMEWTIDQVMLDVVHCRECVHRYPKTGQELAHCRKHGVLVVDGDYCSHGVRREPDGE